MSTGESSKTGGHFPWKEVFAFLGVIITTYIGYLSVRSQVEIPIQATQTAEAKLTQSANKNPTQIFLPPTELPATMPPLITLESPTVSPIPSPIPSPTTIPCDFISIDFPKVDVTIPDGTNINPGDKFTKIWHLINGGSCTWTSEYSLVFVSGTNMGPSAVPITNNTVAPNESVDIAIDLVAPKASGVYRGDYKLQNPAGVIFGHGSKSLSIWVEIIVP